MDLRSNVSDEIKVICISYTLQMKVINYLITVPIHQSRSEKIGNCPNIKCYIKILCGLLYNNGPGWCIYVLTFMNYLFKKLDIKIKTVAPYNNQSSQAEHGIKTLSTILIEHLTNLAQIWPKYLPWATSTYKTFNTPNLANYSPYELVFGRKPRLLLKLETTPDINLLETFKDYYNMLNKRLQYLHKILQDFRSKRLAMINEDRNFFQYKSGDLVYLISSLTSQLHTMSNIVAIKYLGPLVIYKIIDPHNYLLMTLYGEILRGIFEHERLKPTIITASQGNICNGAQ